MLDLRHPSTVAGLVGDQRVGGGDDVLYDVGEARWIGQRGCCLVALPRCVGVPQQLRHPDHDLRQLPE
ncbi:MAG: hypothetical protein JO272_18035 [Pseudonocardiales bacterium]|nr:hypothetical protein [Pseudonocardiales bacterium]